MVIKYSLSLWTVHIKIIAMIAVLCYSKRVAEAFGTETTTQEYDTELMRGHLIHCLEQNEISSFPARSQKSSFADGVRYSA